MKTDYRKLDQKAQVKAGKTHLEVSEVLGVKRQVVTRWWNRYKSSGITGMKMKSRANTLDKFKVNDIQAKAVRKIILDKTPDQLNFGFMLWTREAVRQVLKRNYNIEIGLSAVGRLLKNMGLTPQKPMKKAYEQSSAAVRKWIKEEYPKIQDRAKATRSEIQWGDEMGIRSDDQIGRTYGRRGHTPVVKVTGKRFRANMISSITNRGKLRFMVFKERFTASVFIEFLKRLTKGIKNKIFLIIDGHPVHKSKAVKTWIQENGNKIEIFLLPAYSPELNPDEYLNQDIKQHTRKRRPENQDQMITELRSYLKKNQKNPQKIKNFFQAEKVKYAA
ncbi:MAG: IS630 family transposase [Bdellovibrionaceae bacterium]|nr:IS630 family transposase [Pseudobdellovibrionaceae bacterium]